MKIWIVEISDFLPEIDGKNRLYRAGMLAKALVKEGHQVLWWTSTFNHQLRRQRYDESTTIDIQKKYRLRLLYGPGYKRNISFSRWKHNRAVSQEFARETREIETDGLTDGLRLIETDGLTLGLTEGDKEIETLGLTDGLTLGETEGEREIETLGDTEGLTDGDTLGLREIETEGEILTDGLTLGEALGDGEADGTCTPR